MVLSETCYDPALHARHRPCLAKKRSIDAPTLRSQRPRGVTSRVAPVCRAACCAEHPSEGRRRASARSAGDVFLCFSLLAHDCAIVDRHSNYCRQRFVVVEVVYEVREGPLVVSPCWV